MPADTAQQKLEAIIEYRPQLNLFLQKHGSLTLAQYGSAAISKQSTLSEAYRSVAKKKIASYFGEDVSKKLCAGFSISSSADTSGHGGIFSEDTLLQSHAVIAKGFHGAGAPAFLSLACGVVPMNNGTWPRGFFILGARESIFPKSFDRIAVHECSAFTKEMIEKKLQDKATSPRGKALLEFIRGLPSVFEQRRFYQQTVIINRALWQAFVATRETPEFLQLMLEDLTADLVIESISKDDTLSKLIFCEKKFDVFFKMLSDLPGTWATDRSKGTYLFWHQSGDFRAASLWREGSTLANGQYSIPFTPEGIKAALEKREIVPSVFLSLITLLHNGTRPLGGYHQLSYLPEYRKRLVEFSEIESEVCCPNFLGNIQCINLFNLGYGFAFQHDPENQNILAGIDSFMQFPTLKDEFWPKLESFTVADAIMSNIDRLYNEIVPASKRKSSGT